MYLGREEHGFGYRLIISSTLLLIIIYFFHPPSWGFLHGSVSKESASNAGYKGNPSWIPGSARSPEGGNGNPLQSSCLKKPIDRRGWWATVHGVTNVGNSWVTKHNHWAAPHGTPGGRYLVLRMDSTRNSLDPPSYVQNTLSLSSRQSNPILTSSLTQ